MSIVNCPKKPLAKDSTYKLKQVLNYAPVLRKRSNYLFVLILNEFSLTFTFGLLKVL